ncbi:HAMP domain-containing protein [Vibrio lentus]|nr:HAMP domain-containing protein [Vibrio lentus]
MIGDEGIQTGSDHWYHFHCFPGWQSSPLLHCLSLGLFDKLLRANDAASLLKGDLTQRLEVKSQDEIGQLSKGFNQFLR